MFGASYTDHDQISWRDVHQVSSGQMGRLRLQPPPLITISCKPPNVTVVGGKPQPEPYASLPNSTWPVNGLNPAYWRRADERPHGLPLHHSMDFDCCVDRPRIGGTLLKFLVKWWHLSKAPLASPQLPFITFPSSFSARFCGCFLLLSFLVVAVNLQ